MVLPDIEEEKGRPKVAKCGSAGRFQDQPAHKPRRTAMKNQALIVAGWWLAVGLGVVPACAQADTFQAKVPFSFVVLEKTLPAGDYTLITAPHEIKIRDANARLVAVVLANETSRRSGRAKDQIIFHCYNDRCFLSELQSHMQGNGRQLLVSKTEARLAKEASPKYFAVLGETPVK
jgi:hypothetical protein